MGEAVLGQIQQAVMHLDDALENAQTCRNKLQNPDLQPSVAALIAQLQAAQNQAK